MHHDSRGSERVDGALAVDLAELDGRGGPYQRTIAERCRRLAERVGADPAWSLG
jgi:hypothetical protein